MRAFIAFPLPEEVKTVLGRIRGLFEPAGKSVKWVYYENLHVTIKFLGNINKESLPGITSVIDAAGKKFSPIAAEINRFGFFPNAKNPRVLFAGLNKEPELREIAVYIENGLNIPGVTKTDKPFKAHITLARFKNRGNIPMFLENSKTITLDETVNMENIVLYKSTLTPTGPVYEKIFTASLNT